MGFRVGEFELGEPLGRGGMASVWEGIHVHTGDKVALKVMRGEVAKKPKYQEAFATEIQAMARLCHPCIVQVYDFGDVDTADAAASGELLIGGLPYAVMEFVGGGSLKTWGGDWTWFALKRFLLELLDALAHAHARGVVHRDLKPANVLIDADMHGIRPRLTDFGIARAMDVEDPFDTSQVEQRVAGTPKYMAPEQTTGEWRKQGPWTDLYALGCLAWEASTGAVPFDGKATLVMKAQLGEPLPDYRPSIEVPERFEVWLRTLLRKEPRHRFQRAADAAFALLGISDSNVLTQLYDEPAPDKGFASEYTPTLVFERVRRDDERSDSIESVDLDWPWEPPPIADTWQRVDEPRRAALVSGAGLGLFSLREIPLVGRTDERSMLWRALNAARQSSSPHAIVFRGPAGAGKSRLAEWLTRRAHESGAGQVLRATHAPTPTPVDGLRGMLARHASCVGLDGEQALTRIRDVYSGLSLHGEDATHDSARIAEFIGDGVSGPHSGAPGRRFANRTARYHAILRLLKNLGRTRPVVIWLDDLQWGTDATRFLRFLLAPEWCGQLPLIIVGTLNEGEEGTSGQVEIERLLGDVHATDRGQVVRLEPLSDEFQRELVEALLPLTKDLREEIVARTRGNPLFAIQLLDDWVARHALVAAGGQFMLSANATGTIPDNVHDIWMRRVDTVIRAEDEVPLALAAALGLAVDLEEWRDALSVLGASSSEHLLEDLFHGGLAAALPGGWTFAHGMLRESIERAAQERGDWPRLNAACARALELREGELSPVSAERIGRHWIEAREHARALDPLDVALRFANEAADYDRVERLSELMLVAAETAGLTADDPRRVAPRCRLSAVYRVRGEPDRARTQLSAVLEALLGGRALGEVLREGDRARSVALADALIQSGLIAYESDYDASAALAMWGQAQRFAESVSDAASHVRALRLQAEVLAARGDSARALELARDASRRSDGAEPLPPTARARAHLLLAEVHLRRGELADANRFNELGLSESRALDWRVGESKGLHNAAELARRAGDLDSARRLYAQSHRISSPLGPKGDVVLALSQALVAFEAGEYERERDALEAGLADLEAVGLANLEPYFRFALVVCAAAARDWVAFDEHLDAAEILIARTGEDHRDLARCAELAGELALHVEPIRAERLFEMVGGLRGSEGE